MVTNADNAYSPRFLATVSQFVDEGDGYDIALVDMVHHGQVDKRPSMLLVLTIFSFCNFIEYESRTQARANGLGVRRPEVLSSYGQTCRLRPDAVLGFLALPCLSRELA